tara:strand:- start:75 stop:293 length:219 start_codon:yes stop_codon:yes gene_type:complete
MNSNAIDTAPITAFITKAKASGRTSDAAYGAGVLDAFKGLDCDASRHGLALEGRETELGRSYLGGWCRGNGM